MQVFRTIPQFSDRPLALCIGNFDGIHLGHQAMLKRLREAAREHQLPASVLTFEPHPREFFSPLDAPARLSSLREKLELMRSYGVERVYIGRFDRAFSQITAADFIQHLLVGRLHVRWLLVGSDFRFGAKRGGDHALLLSHAATGQFMLETQPSVSVDGERVSSTGVRDALEQGDLRHASALLGRPYSISGKVVHGRKLGRALGFATANIHLKRRRVPLSGIFAVELAGVADSALAGVASLGVRPTITAGGRPVLEVHLFDFTGDLYSRHVRCEFLYKLRDEAKYPDLATLQRQIEIDVENARRFFNI